MIAFAKEQFKKIDTSIYTTRKDFNPTEIDLWIDTSSISSGNKKQDEHLKSVDFLIL